ncbi:hypothetical protein BpHYR1_030753 [Brachionus plicatilis]|uniref:Uncharacterized protein n=1 Tax=Brachionus plicatilis TaxID=10195 RepID=A0A3M7T8J0_BRAPC|nr:hypothetical protein BpHYR1_030753 [Brachionus plicatilis]
MEYLSHKYPLNTVNHLFFSKLNRVHDKNLPVESKKLSINTQSVPDFHHSTQLFLNFLDYDSPIYLTQHQKIVVLIKPTLQRDNIRFVKYFSVLKFNGIKKKN